MLSYFAGKTLAENLEQLPGLKEGQQVIVPFDKPIKKTGHLQILYGNLAPEGCVGKITGKEGLLYEGTARCFDSEEDMLAALEKDADSFKVSISLYWYLILISLMYCSDNYHSDFLVRAAKSDKVQHIHFNKGKHIPFM